MKPFVKYASSTLALLLIAAVLFLIYRGNSEKRHLQTCAGLRVEIEGDHHFVTKSDIKKYLEEGYGPYIGQRLEEMNLTKIEEVLDKRSAILKSEAFTTHDGNLNIRISQREPIVRFQKGNFGFYADGRGFIFPLQRKYTSLVTVIDGEIPLKVAPGFKGEPEDSSQRKWLGEIIGLVNYMNESKVWADNIVQITVIGRGELVLVPRIGNEKFYFGKPVNIEDKFQRLGEYYKSIVPYKGKNHYSTVNVKYDGQIVCRQ
jgi:cell division protein FtsQ